MNPLAKVLAAGAAIAGASSATYVAATWLRYGRPRKGRGEDADPLLDSLMPDYDVCERHRIAVGAPADVTLAAAKEIDLNDVRIIRAIFRARELLLRSKGEVMVGGQDGDRGQLDLTAMHPGLTGPTATAPRRAHGPSTQVPFVRRPGRGPRRTRAPPPSR